MSCNCPAYAPLNLTVYCFATVTGIGITAAHTEQLSGVIEFAGYEIPFYTTTIAGNEIFIPNKFFNETANHVLKLYRPNGSLLNGVCYPINLTITGGPVTDEGYVLADYVVSDYVL